MAPCIHDYFLPPGVCVTISRGLFRVTHDRQCERGIRILHFLLCCSRGTHRENSSLEPSTDLPLSRLIYSANFNLFHRAACMQGTLRSNLWLTFPFQDEFTLHISISFILFSLSPASFRIKVMRLKFLSSGRFWKDSIPFSLFYRFDILFYPPLSKDISPMKEINSLIVTICRQNLFWTSSTFL